MRRAPFEVITTAQDPFQEVQAAQRAVRTFLNTAQPADLEPYRASTRKVSELIAKLRQLTSDNPEQQRRLPNIELQVNAWLPELERIVRIAETQDFERARAMLQSNVPLDAMRTIGGLLDATIATERSLLTERLTRAAEEEGATRTESVTGAALAFAIMALGIALVPVAFARLRAFEQARYESEQRFRLFVDGVGDYAIYMLDPKGYVIDWNEGATRIKGYSADEIIGQHFSRCHAEGDRNAGLPKRALDRAAKAGKYEEDGMRFLASVVINAVRDTSGQLAGFEKITRDMDERVRQQQALAQYQKMDALGQLTGGIAHDFNNLLHVIKNATEILERRLHNVEPDVRNYLEMLKRNADRAASLTQRLLAFPRRQILDPRSIDPNALIVDVTTLLKQALGERIAIETVLGAGVWWISADASQLETAILNLALNAHDAMPRGGKLMIEITNTFLDESYAAAHVEVKPGQYVTIAVSDTGTGMTKEIADKAFEPFFTTKKVGQGTGLGLSQVYGFIKQSGGHAKIYSEPGAGTTVKLYLPRLSGAAIPQIERKAPSVPSETGKETILVLEDDDDVCQFTAEVLGELRYRVLTVRDAASALRALEDGTDVKLLFTDVGLPGGINGRELADEALKRFPALKVLFTTGYARNALIHHGRLDPGVELILKPFTQSGLADKVRQVLDTALPRA